MSLPRPQKQRKSPSKRRDASGKPSPKSPAMTRESKHLRAGPQARHEAAEQRKAKARRLLDSGSTVGEVARALGVVPNTVTQGWGLRSPRTYTCLDCDKDFDAPARGPLPTRCTDCKKAYHSLWRSRQRPK